MMIDLATLVDAEMHKALCRWAIAQVFDREIALHLLAEEELGEPGEQLWARFEAGFEGGRLSFIRRARAGKYLFEPDVRQAILLHWYSPERHAMFRRLHRKLYEYFEARFAEETQAMPIPAPSGLLHLLTQSLYHLIASDEEGGFQRFEQLFLRYEQVGDALTCQQLLATLEQQSADLSRRRQLWMELYKARLVGLHERLRAAEGEAAIEGESSCAMLETLLQEYGRLRQAAAVNDPALEGWTWNNLGLIAFQRDEYQSAQQHFREAIRSFEDGNLVQEAIAVSGNLALALRQAGQLKAALKTYHSALGRARAAELADVHLQATLWLNLGLAYGDLALQASVPVTHETSEAREARNYFSKAALAYHYLGDGHREGVALALQGRWLLLISKVEEAVIYLQKALDLLETVDAPECEMVHEWLETARRFRKMGEIERDRLLFLMETREHEFQKILLTDYSFFRVLEFLSADRLMKVEDYVPLKSISTRREDSSAELLELGRQAYGRGDLVLAVTWLQNAVEQARRELQVDTELKALDWLSLAWAMMESPIIAFEYATELLSRARLFKSRRYEMIAVSRLAEMHARLDLRNRWTEVRPLLESGLDFAQRYNEPFWEAYHLVRLGQYHVSLGNLVTGESLLKRGLNALDVQTPECEFLRTQLYRSLTDVALRQGQQGEALRYAERALGAAQDYGNTGFEDQARITLARVLRNLGKKEEALTLVEEVLPQAQQLGWKGNEQEARHLQGELLRELGRPEEAEPAVRKALELAQEMKLKEEEVECLLSLGRVLLALHQYDEATEVLKQARWRAQERDYADHFQKVEELLAQRGV